MLFALLIGHGCVIPSFSKEYVLLGKQVKSEIEQQRQQWEKLENAKSEITSFSGGACAAAALLFVVGSLAYMQPDCEAPTISFGENCLIGSVLSASSGILYESLYGKNTICEHYELFLEKLRKLDSYSAEINKKMDDSKISAQERERIEKYMNTLRSEWQEKFGVCKKSKLEKQ